MKKVIMTMIFLMLGVLNLYSQTGDESMKTVRIVTGEWKPYVSEEIDGFGVITEIVSAVLNDMEIDPEYTFLHFYKCYDLVKENKYLGTFPYHEVEGRREEMLFSDSLLTVEYVFFYKKKLNNGDENIIDPNSLNDRRVAIIAGYPINYSYGDTFKSKIDSIQDTVYVQNEVEAFEKLRRESVDIVPASKRVGWNIIREHFVQDKFGIIPGHSSKETVHFIVSKTNRAGTNNEVFIKNFNKSLSKLRQSGILDEIKRRNYDPDLDRYKGEIQAGVVRLKATGRFPLILGREHRRENGRERNENPAYLIPNGTRAIILEWSDKFWKADRFEIHDQMFAETYVQLLQGPLKGDSLWVKNLHIEFE